MERVLDVAAYLFDKYKEVSGTRIDEMKLHKLLYFAQRQSLAVFGSPLFIEPFQAWKYGPVCVDVRSNYTEDGIIGGIRSDIPDVMSRLLDEILLFYGSFESWKLSQMTHDETSWKNARVGLNPDAYGSELIKIEDIQKDAVRSLETNTAFSNDNIRLNMNNIKVVQMLPASWNSPEDDIYDRI